jgi:hypothetical protein
MSASNEDPDQIIRKALAQDEAEEPATGDDPSMAELLTETFRGRNRFLAVAGVVANIVLVLVALYGLTRFFGAQEVRGMLVWGGAVLLSIGLILAVKIWYWLEMVRLAVTRDIKRLELRVSRLTERLEDEKGPS